MKPIPSFLLATCGAVALSIACQSGGKAPEESVASPAAEPPAPAVAPEPAEPTATAEPAEPTVTADSTGPDGGLEVWRAEGEEHAAPVVASAPEAPVVYRLPAAPASQATGPITSAENSESQRRYLTQMRPWDSGHGIYFKTEKDRETARARSLEERAKLRAFEGAPPAMSHSDNFSARSKTCLDCHDQGMTIGERVAHPMSHEPLANCSQCHVEEGQARLGEELHMPDNSFEGLRYSRRGEVSITGAPPAMPHSTHMRTRCLSCHGEYGYPGLKTTHPKRVNCVQCHIEVERF